MGWWDNDVTGGHNAKPYGCFKPLTNMADCSGLPSLVRPRNTRMRPGSLSVTKISPFGTVRRVRGLSRREAYSSTLNPAGAVSIFKAGSDEPALETEFEPERKKFALVGYSPRNWSSPNIMETETYIVREHSRYVQSLVKLSDLKSFPR